MSSRKYIKRIWRVPKDQGPVIYFAALLVKKLVKHGWPAESHMIDLEYDYLFEVRYKDREKLPPDFENALEIACRVVARTYRVDVTQSGGFICLNRPYRVGAGGHFIEVKA